MQNDNSIQFFLSSQQRGHEQRIEKWACLDFWTIIESWIKVTHVHVTRRVIFFVTESERFLFPVCLILFAAAHSAWN